MDDPLNDVLLNGGLRLGVAGFDRLDSEEITDVIGRAVDGLVSEQEARFDRHAPAARAYWMLRHLLIRTLDEGWGDAEARWSVDFCEAYRARLAADMAPEGP